MVRMIVILTPGAPPGHPPIARYRCPRLIIAAGLDSPTFPGNILYSLITTKLFKDNDWESVVYN